MNPSPATRAWIYRAAVGVLPLLVFYGVLTEAAAPLWAAALGAILTNGLAAANTPPREG